MNFIKENKHFKPKHKIKFPKLEVDQGSLDYMVFVDPDTYTLKFKVVSNVKNEIKQKEFFKGVPSLLKNFYITGENLEEIREDPIIQSYALSIKQGFLMDIYSMADIKTIDRLVLDRKEINGLDVEVSHEKWSLPNNKPQEVLIGHMKRTYSLIPKKIFYGLNSIGNTIKKDKDNKQRILKHASGLYKLISSFVDLKDQEENLYKNSAQLELTN